MSDTPRWCPFTNLATSRRADSFNRTVETDVESEPTLPLATMCVQDKCQMWTGSDCGLKR